MLFKNPLKTPMDRINKINKIQSKCFLFLP